MRDELTAVRESASAPGFADSAIAAEPGSRQPGRTTRRTVPPAVGGDAATAATPDNGRDTAATNVVVRSGHRRPAKTGKGVEPDADPRSSPAVTDGALEGILGLEGTRAEISVASLSYPTPPVVSSNQKVQWDFSQVVGPPDTPAAGDHPTAWAPRSPQSGVQWLQVGYDRTVEVREINIHQSYNPGAISRVTALRPDGSERTVWEGNAGAGEGIVEASVPVPPGITANQLKIYVDTDRVASWPEIDAVEMVGTDGSRQWASQASASSSYSSIYSR